MEYMVTKRKTMRTDGSTNDEGAYLEERVLLDRSINDVVESSVGRFVSYYSILAGINS
jgi:hypothetical protein